MSAPLGRRVLAVALVLAPVGLATPALASPHAAALMPLLRPNPNPELRQRFHDAVTRGIDAAGAQTAPAAEVRMRLGASPELNACGAAGPCAARAAMALGVDELVATEIVVAGKDYTIHVRLLDPAGRETNQVDDECDICTQKDAEDTVAKATQKLIASAKPAEPAPAPTPPAPVPPETTTAPPAATPTPAPAAPAPAPTPAPTPAPKTMTERKRFPWRWVAVGSLAAGVVGLAIGIPLLAIDGHPTCSPPPGQDPYKVCPEVYNTAGGGGVMTAIGVGGLLAGGALFFMDWYTAHHAPATKVAIVPLLEGGALATVGGRF